MKNLFFIFTYYLLLFIISSLTTRTLTLAIAFYTIPIPFVSIILYFQQHREYGKSFRFILSKHFFIVAMTVYILLICLWNTFKTGDLVEIINNLMSLLAVLGMPFCILTFSFIASFYLAKPTYYVKKISQYASIATVISSYGFVLSMLKVNEITFSYQFASFVYTTFIPFIFLIKRKYNYLYGLLLFAAILLTQKRGPLIGIIAGSISIILFSKTIKTSRKISITMLAILSIIAIALIMPDTVNSITDRFENESLESDNYGSGRGILWNLHWNSFNKGSLDQQIFGFGPSSSYQLTRNLIASGTGSSAHNAYISIGYQEGAMGLILYISMLLNMLFIVRTGYKIKYRYCDLMLFITIYIITTGFSTVHFESYPIIFPLFLFGFLSGILYREKYKIKTKTIYTSSK